MARVVTTQGVAKCSHQGTVQLSSQSKLKVGSSPVLLLDDMVGMPVGPDCTNKGGNLKPCTTVVSVLPGSGASTLRIAGNPAKPVLLETAGGATDSTPPGTWSVQDPGQAKLDAS